MGREVDRKESRELQECSGFPRKKIKVRPAKDMYDSPERLQRTIGHSS